jgi:hypothetical protein
MSTHYSSRLTQPQAKLITPVGMKPQEDSFADDYWEAMKLEVATLENIDAWSVVDRYDSNGEPHHVIPSTRIFKCKRYPDGRIMTFKARFCARGDKQLEGIDFFKTYALVVHWTTMTNVHLGDSPRIEE